MRPFIIILNYIDIIAPLLTLLFFIKPFKRLPKELFYVFAFVCVQFLTNLVAKIMEIAEIPNYAIYVSNVILSFGVLTMLFYVLNNSRRRRVIIGASVVFAIVAAYSIANGDGIYTYNSVLSAVGSSIITAYCLLYFYRRLLKDKRDPGLMESSFFWIVIGIFTYYAGSFFIFISYEYLIVQDATGATGILWRFHNVLLTIFCIYTIYSLTCRDYQKI